MEGRVIAGEVDREEAMLGDVNFFLYPYHGDTDDDDADGGEHQEEKEGDWIGEVDVMVAEDDWRGKGVGFAAVTALMTYLHRHLDEILEEHARGSSGSPEGGPRACPSRRRLRSLVAKIKEGNGKSVTLFRKVGFVQRGGVNYFGELEMVLDDFDGFMSRICQGAEKGERDERSWGRELAETYREVIYSRGT